MKKKVSSHIRLTAKKGLLGLIVVILSVVLIGSSSPVISNWLTGIIAKSDIPILYDSGDMTSTMHATVDASNQFAFDLYRRYSTKGGNILFSPCSSATAL